MKLLELSESPIETFQATAFILSILLAHENVKNAYYNKYINLEGMCDPNKNLYLLTFSDGLWGVYDEDGIAEVGIHFIKDIPRNEFFSFMTNLIDQNNYLLLYIVDEYYLSYSKYYHSIHRIHDTYIYGYDDTNFYILAYNQGKLSRIKVDAKEVEEALYHQLNVTEDVSFCHFRFYDNCNVSIDFKCIRDQLELYLQGTGVNDKKLIYGIKTYDIINNYLDYMDKNPLCDINYKHFRVLWEHKKIMCERVEKLSKMIDIDNSILDTSKEIERLTNSLFMLVIKYNVKRSEIIIDRAKKQLNVIKEKEVKMITDLINSIS